MFKNIREELAAIECLIEGIGKQPVSHKNAGNYVDTYCEVKDLAKRLKALEMDVGDALRSNFRGALATPNHRILITKPMSTSATSWAKVADELQNYVDSDTYARVVGNNTKSGIRRPAIRVEI